MLATALLFGLLAVATLTDVRWRKIYNTTTYPGILLALFANGAATWMGVDAVTGSEQQFAWYGLVGLWDSLLGLLACGGVMIVCYVFFAGGIGGGDIKLIAMIGALMVARDLRSEGRELVPESAPVVDDDEFDAEVQS